MPRGMVGLLAAVGAIMSALIGFTHGDLIPVIITACGTGTGLAAYLAASPQKKAIAKCKCKNHSSYRRWVRIALPRPVFAGAAIGAA
jgi:hypothetical protein